MQLTANQVHEYNERGFLVLPELFSPEEISVLRAERDRIAAIETDHAVRFAKIRTIYRVHELDGPTASAVYHAVGRMPRLLEPAMQLLNDKDLYILNSRLYSKDAFVGTSMLWHQDFGYWKADRVPTPNLVQCMIMLTDVDVLDGCLVLVPGSHRLGQLPHYSDASSAFKHMAVKPDVMSDILRTSPRPVPVTGKAGTVAMFSSLVIHASTHNFSSHDRWQMYYVYNPVSNRPAISNKSRPEFVSSHNFEPLRLDRDDALMAMAE